jgi:hypothetical protein
MAHHSEHNVPWRAGISAAAVPDTMKITICSQINTNLPPYFKVLIPYGCIIGSVFCPLYFNIVRFGLSTVRLNGSRRYVCTIKTYQGYMKGCRMHGIQRSMQYQPQLGSTAVTYLCYQGKRQCNRRCSITCDKVYCRDLSKELRAFEKVAAGLNNQHVRI